MGSGGGNPAYFSRGSGQNGGRIMPGSQSGRLLALNTPSGQLVGPTEMNGQFTTTLVQFVGGRGGGPGQIGDESESLTPEYPDWSFTNSQGETVTITVRSNLAGGGGGWGAAGGDTVNRTGDPATDPFYFPGGAAGKAINTNGHAVTWVGGADRAYGAIG